MTLHGQVLSDETNKILADSTPQSGPNKGLTDAAQFNMRLLALIRGKYSTPSDDRTRLDSLYRRTVDDHNSDSIWNDFQAWRREDPPLTGEDAARAAVDKVKNQTPADALRDAADVTGLTAIAKTLSTIAGAISKAAGWVANPHNWQRVAEVIGGIVTAIVGFQLLARSGSTIGQAVTRTAALPTKVVRKVR